MGHCWGLPLLLHLLLLLPPLVCSWLLQGSCGELFPLLAGVRLQ